MPYLLSPGWLVLLPALVAVGWAWGHLGLFRPLRIVGIICAVFALADPVAGWLRSGMDLWVVIRSFRFLCRSRGSRGRRMA